MKPLPPDLEVLMPEPVGHIHSDGDFCWVRNPNVAYWPEDLYTATQMREAILAATEKAAKVCEDLRFLSDKPEHNQDNCVAAIRGTK